MLLRCFSSQAFLLTNYLFICGLQGFILVGFPHSDSHGSRPFSSSPWLFAALHVLPRLSVPRYPPLALRSFTYFDLVLFSSFPPGKSEICSLPSLSLRAQRRYFLTSALTTCLPHSRVSTRCVRFVQTKSLSSIDDYVFHYILHSVYLLDNIISYLIFLRSPFRS